MKNVVFCEDVFKWPEFQAFAKRLGISIEAETTHLIITLKVDECPLIFHEFLGQDLTKKSTDGE